MVRISHVYRLGGKELWSILRDPVMLVLIAYGFSLLIYIAATSMPDTLNKVPIAIVDEDRSPLSTRIISAFQPPEFQPPYLVDLKEVDTGLDAGYFTFSLDIPPNFQRDVLAGKSPAIQLNVDATRMSQAFSGAGYAQQIVMEEINEFIQGYRETATQQVELTYRIRFNPNMSQKWFGSIIELIEMVTMLSIILAGAALIREREHGTIEHLLVMPMTPAEIMLAKVWATGIIVLVASTLSVTFVIKGWLGIPIQGSIWFFVLLTGLYLFSTTSMGIFMATIARSMPQFGLLMMLVMMPMLMLSGGVTPRESMPVVARVLMEFMPSTHYVSGTQAILYRGADIDVIVPQIVSLLAIGLVFFTISLLRFRHSVSQAD
ncbi:ABC transporter permease [Methylophaga sp. OBS1]|uniref:ABC transporter permease n=1 Tax=Methylophaga sp. OBS1 TaxID=2991933 RepID=UPI0022502630|nr:ABC transporter permease [Methylophaga sp. OBS1]MCX4191238.1 ABC transporter permease [Methylophaga sp. OBS1]MCX4191816.1 ABC transporter permease [Methylophaga sp. OBS1]